MTSKNPLQLQFPFALWTRAMIGTLIRRQYGIKLSAISVGRLLGQMGLSCQKPLSRAFEQDARLVKQWIERDFPKIRALAKKERAVVFFADESGVRSDFHAGTTWGIRGKTPVVRHTGKRFHLNMLSAISAQGELRFMTSRKRLSAALFIEFLRRLITNYPKKIFLVVDGLPAHKATERPPPTVLSPAVLAGNQSGRTGLERRQEPRRCSSIDPHPQRFASRSEFKVATAAKKSTQSPRVLLDGNDALCSRIVPNI